MTKNLTGNLFETAEGETIQSKKDMILSLYNSGTKEIEAIAAISGAKPSYVGSVLQKEGVPTEQSFSRQRLCKVACCVEHHVDYARDFAVFR